MSLHSTPILYLNMGGEMLYVLRQRLKAQKIEVDKTIQVLNDVTGALLNSKILSSMFVESPLIGISSLRSTLEHVTLSSIMKLDKSSMDKLFDLMIMMVKYQLTAATGPGEVILLTLNHIDAMHDMVCDVNVQKCISLVHEMIMNFYGCLTCDEVWSARQTCLNELDPYNVRVSILLRRGLQNEDASFNIMAQKYDEKYMKHRDNLSTMKIKEMNPEMRCGATFDIFSDRKTLLGKNIYLPTYGIEENLNPKRDNQHFLKDCGAKAELGMLAVQLGTEENNYERPFGLNLLSNEEENSNNINADCDFDGNDIMWKIESDKSNLNKDYKAKLDNVYADFLEDEHEGLKRSMNLLDLLDEMK